MANETNPPRESVCQEAERIVNGPRRDAYGHPFQNFSDTAALLNALLRKRLKEDLIAEDVAIIMVALKLAREQHKHGRDNLVDIVGYVACLERVIERREDIERTAAERRKQMESAVKA